MTLKPPQLPLPDDPIEAFLYALMAAVDVSLLLTQVRNEREETDFFREGSQRNPLRGRGRGGAEAM